MRIDGQSENRTLSQPMRWAENIALQRASEFFNRWVVTTNKSTNEVTALINSLVSKTLAKTTVMSGVMTDGPIASKIYLDGEKLKTLTFDAVQTIVFDAHFFACQDFKAEHPTIIRSENEVHGNGNKPVLVQVNPNYQTVTTATGMVIVSSVPTTSAATTAAATTAATTIATATTSTAVQNVQPPIDGITVSKTATAANTAASTALSGQQADFKLVESAEVQAKRAEISKVNPGCLDKIEATAIQKAQTWIAKWVKPQSAAELAAATEQFASEVICRVIPEVASYFASFAANADGSKDISDELLETLVDNAHLNNVMIREAAQPNLVKRYY